MAISLFCVAWVGIYAFGFRWIGGHEDKLLKALIDGNWNWLFALSGSRVHRTESALLSLARRLASPHDVTRIRETTTRCHGAMAAHRFPVPEVAGSSPADIVFLPLRSCRTLAGPCGPFAFA
jgi:hypothetical protein